ncbi:MAG: DUF4214 domain-containing protein [Betaproteobacteria bacterium]|mgnify:CR=1 FL=1|nr:DUF4214 domain-containing protein [Betaproteobacteria bacterium]
MAAYTTLDYLPDLYTPWMNSAPTLSFFTYTGGGDDWDHYAMVLGTDADAISHPVYKFDAIAGATYDIFCTSVFDPFGLLLYDSLGNAIAINSDQADYVGGDVIWDWVAPYSGIFYVNAGWNQNSTASAYSLSIYEDIDILTQPAIGITAGQSLVNEGQIGSTPFSFTVTRTGILAGASSVLWYVSSSQANGSDFAGGLFPSGAISFATGESSKTVTIYIAGDSVYENDESFTVTLNSPSGATISTATIPGGIRNDDSALVSTNGDDTLDGTSGDDQIWGGTGHDMLSGNAGNDTLYGDAGDDGIFGDSGDDIISGGDGDDNVWGGAGNDFIDGGPGQLDAVAYTQQVTVNLSSGVAFGGEGIDSISSIEWVFGSDFGDSITGDANENSLFGGDGNDTLFGEGGNDYLNGGLGDDFLDGGDGIDILSYAEAVFGISINITTGKSSGGHGIDTFQSIENVGGSNFDDVIIGSVGANALIGGDGADVVYGQNGDDHLIGGRGDDILDGGEGMDWLDYTSMTSSLIINLTTGRAFGEGSDQISNIEIVSGGSGTDTIVGNEIANLFSGNAGNDFMYGSEGNDQLGGDAGDDFLDGGAGFDIATFADNVGNYTLIKSGNTYTVRANSGTDEVDTLTNVEWLDFDDISVSLTIQAKAAGAPQADVTRLAELYVAFFNRVPDANGLEYWIDQMGTGQNLNQIADAFYSAGVQYSSQTGFSASMSNSDFIKVIYHNVLGRSGATAPPDADVNYWVSQLVTGADTRGSLINTMLGAAHSFKGDATWGWVPDLLDNKIVVAKTFAIDFG